MQRIQEVLENIRVGLKNGTKDHSLIIDLNREILIPLDSHIFTSFARSAFNLYDLSNHHSLIKRSAGKPGQVQLQHDSLGLALKLASLKMLTALVSFCNDNTDLEISPALLRQCCQIMILIARILIDTGHSPQIKSLYSLASTLYQVTTGLSIDIEMLHFLNCLELLRLDADTGILDVHYFRRQFQLFLDASRKMQGVNPYIDLANYITFEVILKLIKAGQTQRTKQLRVLLSPKLLQVIDSVCNFEGKLLETQLSQISPFYELYLSLKNNKQQVSQERLKNFICSEENFNDPRIFDVIALTQSMMPLEIWLEVFINNKQRCDNISNAYRCYSFLVDKSFLCQQGLIQNQLKIISTLGEFIKISHLVILCLLLERKESQQPILFTLRRILKVMIHCVLHVYPNSKQLRDFAQKVLLVCSKFGLGDLGRVVNCVIFYYEVLIGTAGEESYTKFYKSGLIEKGNGIFKIIKLAYNIRIGKATLNSEDAEIIKREPYLAILFQKELKQSIILNIPPEQFCLIPQKFEIYFMLSCTLANGQSNEVQRVAGHMEQVLIRMELSQITKLDLKYILLSSLQIFRVLSLLTPVGKVDELCSLARVQLYLISICYFSCRFQTTKTGLLLNRFSKLMKILSIAFESFGMLSQKQNLECIEKYLYLCKSTICWTLERLKLQKTSQNNNIFEPGMIAFLELLHGFIIVHEKNPAAIQFAKFVRFQISCLTDSVGQEISMEKNTKLLKLYCSSKWIKRGVKLRILRKLVKEQLISQSKQLTIEDLSDLITLAESMSQKRMYVEYLLKLFGQEGKVYLLLQSSLHPLQYEFLAGEGEDQIL